MTWLGKWIQIAGAWFGSYEPEAPGAMRATLRGSSSVSGLLEYQSEPIPADMSAELYGSSTVSVQVQKPAGGAFGLVRKIRTFWKPDPIIINIAADLHGGGIIKGSTCATAGMVAGLSGGGSATIKAGASGTLSAGLSGTSKATGRAVAIKHVQQPVVAEMAASLQGSGRLTARLDAVHVKIEPIAADNHDDDMTMILLLVA